MPQQGKYIIIEGADGTGKSTQADMLQAYLKTAHDINSIQIHEPDGFEGSEELGIPAVTGATELRKLIKNGTVERDPWTNVILFTAARRLNWQQAIKPALEKGIWVVSARNYLSTIAYQGYGEGVDIERIVDFTRENVSQHYLNPDLSIILTLGNEDIRSSRITERGELEHPDTFESKSSDFQTAMQNGYINYAKKNNIATIDATSSRDNAHKELAGLVSKSFSLEAAS